MPLPARHPREVRARRLVAKATHALLATGDVHVGDVRVGHLLRFTAALAGALTAHATTDRPGQAWEPGTPALFDDEAVLARALATLALRLPGMGDPPALTGPDRRTLLASGRAFLRLTRAGGLTLPEAQLAAARALEEVAEELLVIERAATFNGGR